MCDCMDYAPDVYKCREIKGRKQHTCCECLRLIGKGESHEYVKGLWDGEWSVYRTCNTCTAMRDEVGLTCYCFGQMMDCLDERDFPKNSSVAKFHQRRNENYWRRKREREAVAN